MASDGNNFSWILKLLRRQWYGPWKRYLRVGYRSKSSTRKIRAPVKRYSIVTGAIEGDCRSENHFTDGRRARVPVAHTTERKERELSSA